MIHNAYVYALIWNQLIAYSYHLTKIRYGEQNIPYLKK